MIKKRHHQAFDNDHYVVVCDSCGVFIRQGLALEQVLYEFCADCARLAECEECGVTYKVSAHPKTRCPECGSFQPGKALAMAEFISGYWGRLIGEQSTSRILKIIMDAPSDEEWVKLIAEKLGYTSLDVAARIPL